MKTAIQKLLEDSRLIKLQQTLGDDVELYPVGGTVRDALLNRPIKDLDLACNLPATDCLKILEANNIRVIATGLQHDTITALPDPELDSVEITTFRANKFDPDAKHSIETDLVYRDFTINALAIKNGKIVDVTSGRADLENKTIRVIDHKRFSEDPLRILRMIRFSCTFSFNIEEQTRITAKNFIPNLDEVSIERIRDEFSKILLSPEPDRGIRLLVEDGFMQKIIPELLPCVDFEQNKYHKEDVFNHTMEVLKNTSPILELRLSALLHDIAKPNTLSIDEDGGRHFFQHEKVGSKMTKEILKRLKYPGAVIKDVANLVYTHMRPLEAGPGGMRRLLRDTEENYPLWRELKEADAGACKIDSDTLQERLAAFDAAIEEVKKGPQVSPLKNLAIGGDDLIDLGFKPSKKFAEILKGLHEMVLDQPELNEKKVLIKIVKDNHLTQNKTNHSSD